MITLIAIPSYTSFPSDIFVLPFLFAHLHHEKYADSAYL
jgi:hypothetical protein